MNSSQNEPNDAATTTRQYTRSGVRVRWGSGLVTRRRRCGGAQECGGDDDDVGWRIKQCRGHDGHGRRAGLRKRRAVRAHERVRRCNVGYATLVAQVAYAMHDALKLREQKQRGYQKCVDGQNATHVGGLTPVAKAGQAGRARLLTRDTLRYRNAG